MLKDPKQEARAEALGSQLRCLVCQNESIEESNAELAHDLRAVVRQRITAGDTDPQIIAWMTARYGTFILLKPPLTPATFLLWATPALALIGGFIATLVGLRAKRPAPAPLTEAERLRLDELSRHA